jgi:hypothetical protein
MDPILFSQKITDFYYNNWWKDVTADGSNPDPSKQYLHFWQISNQLIGFLRMGTVIEAQHPQANFWFKVLNSVPNDPTVPLPAQHGLIPCAEFYVKLAIQKGNPKGYWTDDFGWGGLACLAASDFIYNHNVPWRWETWRDYAISCFDHMTNLYDYSDAGKPVKGGITNTMIKNTVTNTVYFSFCMNLYDFFKRRGDVNPVKGPAALRMAYRQYVYFKEWFATKKDPSKGLDFDYLQELNNVPKNPPFNPAMIQERPVCPPPYGTYPEYGGNPYEDYSTWSADQGLYLNAACLLYTYADDLPRIVDPNINVGQVRANLVIIIRQILVGSYYGHCSPAVDNVIRESPFYNILTSNGGDVGDYVCGRGVFCREIMLDSTTLVLRNVVPDFLSAYYGTPIKETLTAIYDDGPTGKLSAWWRSKNDPAAFQKFKEYWGQADVDVIPETLTDPVFVNYCQLNGFDILTAYLLVIKGKSAEQNVENGSAIDSHRQHHKGLNGHHENKNHHHEHHSG